MKQGLDLLSLVELNNLFFKETAEFVAAIGNETSEQLEARTKQIRLIDKAIEKAKAKKLSTQNAENNS